MGRTYWTGPPKWKCPNCGRVNKMKESPAKGHSVQKKCSGCDEVKEVKGHKPVTETISGLTGKIQNLFDFSKQAKENRKEKKKFEENSLKDDEVILQDRNSEYDGQKGQVTRVWEDMFGNKKYNISFNTGKEQGVAEESIKKEK